jgi:fumarate reductase subunit C
MKNGHHFEYKPIRTKNLKAVNRRLKAREEAFAWRFFFALTLIFGCITFSNELSGVWDYLDEVFNDLNNQAILLLSILALGSVLFLVYWIKKQ